MVIGAGHNGLICAGYLAKAGLKVIVFEQWHKAGGCVQTEELIPNFQITPSSVDHIMIQATPILQELELESRFGLKYLKVDPIFSVPFPDGKYFFIHEDLKKTCDSKAANISVKDAENYNNFVRFWMKGFGAVRPLLTGPLYPLKDALLNGKEEYAETIIDKMEEYIPDLRKLIIGRYIASPDDLKKRIGDTCASHVDSFLDQHLIFRPTRKLSGYKTPVKGLFVTGVGGTSGRNAAKIVLKELRGKVFGRDTVKYGTMAYEIISTLLSGKSN